MKKALVVVIIVLFLGVGFQPALANEISITTISDIGEDCGCQPVNRFELLRVKLLLIRMEAITNLILSKFGHIPDIREKCEEISDKIITLKEMNKELNPNLHIEDISPLCSVLFMVFIITQTLIEILPSLDKIPILKYIFMIPYATIAALMVMSLLLLYEFDCITGPDL